MSSEQKLCTVKIIQLQSMSNALRFIDLRFALKNFLISCPALIFNLNNPRTTVLYAKKSVAGGDIGRRLRTSRIPFFSGNRYEPWQSG